jgi:hypothetical protein
MDWRAQALLLNAYRDDPDRRQVADEGAAAAQYLLEGNQFDKVVSPSR